MAKKIKAQFVDRAQFTSDVHAHGLPANVKRNRGAAGGDRQRSVSSCTRNISNRNQLALMRQLKDGSFRPHPLAPRPHPPRADGKTRPLGIPRSPRPPLLRKVLRLLLNPFLSRRIFHDDSLRLPARHEAVTWPWKAGHRTRRLRAFMRARCRHQKGSLTISRPQSHYGRPSCARKWPTATFLRLVERFLKARGDGGNGRLFKHRLRSARHKGGVIFPLACQTIALKHSLDWRPPRPPGFRFVRYADDFVVLCARRRRLRSRKAHDPGRAASGPTRPSTLRR